MPQDDANTTLDERRAAERHAVDVDTTLRVGGLMTGCRLLEMSAVGARLAAAEGLAVGDLVVLDLPQGGQVEATVVRSTQGYVAVAFAGAVIVTALSH